MSASSKKSSKKSAFDHNSVYAALVFSITVLLLVNLLQYGTYQKQHRELTKVTAELHNESLKRDYFEWRESKSTGHTVDKTKYPRWEELVDAGVTKQ